MWKHFICNYGIPERIHTDQGRNFESNLLVQLWKLLGISKSRTTPYHPQGNGTTEWFNRTLMNMLGTLCPEQKANWKDYVESMTHAYNCTRHESTGFSPFFLMFGRHPKLKIDLALGLPHRGNEGLEVEEYVSHLRKCLETAYHQAAQASEAAKHHQKKYYDRQTREAPLIPGDRVLVAKVKKGRQKLGDRWESTPYIVIRRQGDLPVYVVQPETGGGELLIHRNRITPCMFLPIDGVSQPVGREVDMQEAMPENEGSLPLEAGAGIELTRGPIDSPGGYRGKRTCRGLTYTGDTRDMGEPGLRCNETPEQDNFDSDSQFSDLEEPDQTMGVTEEADQTEESLNELNWIGEGQTDWDQTEEMPRENPPAPRCSTRQRSAPVQLDLEQRAA
nr:uncharacterized protein LOC112546537 [Pelodiscus sinensis]|eukprot:XP_025042814.1 uncharacterized protein LOC112546537 [Pelodiscus sinensis]